MDYNSRLVLLGSPLVDLTCEVSQDFLLKFGLEPDRTYPVTESNRKVFEELEKFDNIMKTVGGSILNTARSLKKLTTEPILFLGSIGTDPQGKLIITQLQIEEIPVKLTEIPNKPTGKVAVLLQKTTRTLVTDLGASLFFPLEEINKKTLENCEFFYFSLLFLNVSIKIIQIPDILKETCTIIINLGATFLFRKFPAETVALIRKSRLIFGNESEYLALAEILQIKSEKIHDILQKIKFTGRFVVTRGEKSVLIGDNGTIVEFPVKKIEKICSTNGAGDAFVAGFLARFIEGANLEKCVEKAVKEAQKGLIDVKLENKS